MFSRALLVAAVSSVLLAASAQARPVYVGDAFYSSVTIFDSNSGQAIGGISLPASVAGMGISPDGKRLVVSHGSAEEISVFDTATRQQVGSTIPAPGDPGAVAFSPDGSRAFVSGFLGGQVYVVDPSTGALLSSPKSVGASSEAIALSTDGTRLYVPDVSEDEVRVLDPQTLVDIAAPISVGEEPRGIVAAPDGSRIYVSNENSNSITVIDPGSNQVVGTPIPAGNGPTTIAITPDSAHAIVADFEDESTRTIDLRTGQAAPQVPLGAKPGRVAIDPSGQRAYLGIQGQKVPFLDIAANSLLPTFATAAGEPAAIVVAPDQPPVVRVTGSVRNGVLNLSAGGTTDPDSAIASYAWNVGGAAASGPEVTQPVAFGSRSATVTATDAEGCSTTRVFNGAFDYCNGSGVATAGVQIETLKVGKLKRKPKKGTATLTIQTSAAGTVTLAGKQVLKSVRKAKKAGSVTLTVKAKGRGKNKLAKSGAAKLASEISFQPDAGLPVVQTAKVKLVKRRR